MPINESLSDLAQLFVVHVAGLGRYLPLRPRILFIFHAISATHLLIIDITVLNVHRVLLLGSKSA